MIGGFRKTASAFTAALLLCLTFLFSSCQNILGYSVLLWNVEDENLADGTVVPVYIKSNISHVYVIGLGNSKDSKKVEVPLWKLTEPESKSKAQKRALSYSDYKGKYAVCVLDGLPIRQDRVNTSKQVYRLRKGEIIRTLYEGNGAIPTNGKSNLEGKWLRVLTSTGVQGWCFSYNLRLFEMNADGSYGEGAVEANVQERDELLEKIFSSKWYPDFYSSMVKSKNIDLNNMKLEYGFDTGSTSGTVSLVLPILNVSAKYNGVSKTSEGVYKFTDTPFQLTVYNSNSISVQYTDSRGMPKSYNFISFDEELDVSKLIEEELLRRAQLYNAIKSAGPDYKSSYYGTITFEEDETFRWTGFSQLVPSVIERGALSRGTVKIQYSLPNNLKAEWDGVLTLKFDGMEKDVNFLYKQEQNGLRMAVANVAQSRSETTGRSSYRVSLTVNSLVVFFQK